MFIPGGQARSGQDKECAIKCACGSTLTTLKPGQRAVRCKTGASQEEAYTCSTCNRTTKVYLEQS